MSFTIDRANLYKCEIRAVTDLRNLFGRSVADTDLQQKLDQLLCMCYHWLQHGDLKLFVKYAGSTGYGALYKFLDAAGGEGLVLGGIDAGDLFFQMFPEHKEPDPTPEELDELLNRADEAKRAEFVVVLQEQTKHRGAMALVFPTYEQKLAAWKACK